MIKKLRLFSTLLLLAVASMAWGEEVTWSHVFSSPEAIANNSITVDDVTWNITTTAGQGSPTMTTGNYSQTYGLKFGSSKSVYYGSVTFSTDYFNNYNVKSVKVNILNNGSKEGTLTAQQGTTSIGSDSKTFGQAWTDLTVNSTQGSGGTLSFTYQVQQAFYIHSIEVVYEQAGGTPVDPSVATTTTIDASGITNTDVFTSTAAGQLTATVTAGETTVSGATVTWSSSKEDVATIDANTGVVTLVAAGTTTITASYAGVEGQYLESSATYNLIVTSSAPYVQPTTVEINMNYEWLGSESGKNLSNDAFPVVKTDDNVTTTIAKGTSTTNTRGDTDYIRLYNGSSISFEAPEDYVITGITFTTGGSGTWNVPTLSVGTLSDKSWIGSAASVTFTMTGSCFISKATITLTKAGLPIPELSFSSTTAEATIGEAFTAPTLSNESGVAVTYSSSDETVATVDASNGTVTLVAAGTTTIIAEFAGNETYAPNSASYTLTVKKAAEVEDGFFNFEDKRLDYGSGVTTTDEGSNYITENKTWVAGNVTLVTSGKYRWWDADGTLRFYSNDPASTMTFSVPEGYVITNIEITGGLQWAANLGTYTATDGKWEGKSQEVVFTYNSTKSINVATVRVTYEEGAAKQNPELAFSATEVTANLREAFTAPTLTFAEGFNGTITYSSTKTDVATVNETTGEVSIAAAGITTIKAEFAGDNDWNASSASYTLTVVDPNAPGSENYPYTVSEALAAEPADNLYVTGIISQIDEVSTEHGNATYYISDDGTTTGQMKVYRGKYLANAAFTAEGQIEVGNIVVVKGNIRVYQNENQLAQGNYITSQKVPVTISENAKGKNDTGTEVYFGTLYYSNKHLKMSGSNLGAHPIKVVDGKITELVTYSSNRGDVIPAGTAVMLEAREPGTYTFEVVTEAPSYTAPSDNMLRGTDKAATTYAGEGNWKYYKLTTKGGSNLGFYFGADDGAPFTNGAHKAYLAVPADQASAKGFVLGEETTGINAIDNSQQAVESIYNLSGQRVQKATKGVYIVNGKKVVMK